MKSQDKLYDEGTILINQFLNSTGANKPLYQGIISRQDITYALALLQDGSGIIRSDYRLSKLCADCFMLGVFVGNSNNHKSTNTELKETLKNMGLKPDEIKNAEAYANNNSQSGDIKELVTLALKYHGGLAEE